MIEVTLLGTSCMVPTKERNVSSIYLEYNGEGILFDCGEGTQRQMNIANIPRTRVKKIFISHWHGDHVSGILGLLQTIGNSVDDHSLEIFGPVETKKRFNYLMKSTSFSKGNREENLKVAINESKAPKLTKIYENEHYLIEAISLDHNIPTLGFSFIEKDRLRIQVSKTKKLGIPDGPVLGKLQQGKDIVFKDKKYKAEDLTYVVKGKKITILMDTSYTKNAILLAKDADILISEATYLDKHLDRGEKYKHLTMKQAAQIAHNANVNKLVMVHISQRYKEKEELESEARDIFPNSYLGFDLMKIKL